MTDFGRKDFGAALKKMFEAGTPQTPEEMDPNADEIGGFQGSDKTAGLKGDKELEGLGSGKGSIGAQLKAFAKSWESVKKIIKQQSEMAVKQLEAYTAANPNMVYSGKATTNADAKAAAFGDPTQVADKFDRADAAGGRETHATSTGKFDKISGADIRGSRKGKKVKSFDGSAGVTPGAADDFAASQVQGPAVERERMNRERAARAAAAQGGK